MNVLVGYPKYLGILDIAKGLIGLVSTGALFQLDRSSE